jgi:hypothetical protein
MANVFGENFPGQKLDQLYEIWPSGMKEKTEGNKDKPVPHPKTSFPIHLFII